HGEFPRGTATGPSGAERRRTVDRPIGPYLGGGADRRTESAWTHGLHHVARPGRERLRACGVSDLGPGRAESATRTGGAGGGVRQTRLLRATRHVLAARPGDPTRGPGGTPGPPGTVASHARGRGCLRPGTQTVAAVLAEHRGTRLRS